MTPHGFIEESPNALNAYKKSRQEEWSNILGGADFKLVGEEEFAKRVNVQVEKNHINGVTTRGRIIMTPHGFIKDTPTSLNNYKKARTQEWSDIMGGSSFNIVEEEHDLTDISTYTQEP